jgi:sterol desaturase/sphingolipid hydroxylase (fatty acid hydroxylase superfamily)
MWTIALSFLLGVSLWPCLEYGLHNWLGHVARGRNAFSREHLKHHAVKDFFAPAYKKALAAIPIFTLTYLASGLVAGWANGAALTLGFAVTYLSYEVVHRRAHVYPPTGPYSRWVRKNHFFHHFVSPKTNHGVTTPFFDLLFGTHRRPDVIRVPERFAMRWLIDPTTGDVREEFRGDYALRRSRSSAAGEGMLQQADLEAAYDGSAPAD